jgi:hypothetical protein
LEPCQRPATTEARLGPRRQWLLPTHAQHPLGPCLYRRTTKFGRTAAPEGDAIPEVLCARRCGAGSGAAAAAQESLTAVP